MQFNVPQFIEIEDKIIGPLTLKQFLYLAAGVGVLFILWFFLTLSAFIIAAIIIAIPCLALAFYRPSGRPLIYLVKAWLNYILKPRLYLWRKH